jgi:hypothetical protein
MILGLLPLSLRRREQSNKTEFARVVLLFKILAHCR